MFKISVELSPKREPVLLAEVLPQVLAHYLHDEPPAPANEGGQYLTFELGTERDLSLACL